MPGLDKTGPRGLGAMTGRGLGPCGCGKARGRKFGCGRGAMTKQEEIELLKEEQEEINKRLEQLKKE